MESATASDFTLSITRKPSIAPPDDEFAALSAYVDPVLELAWWVGISAIAISLLAFLLVILMRLRLFARQRREQRAVEFWRPLLAQCADRVPEQLRPLERGEEQAVLQLWNHYHESLRGAATEQLNQLAAGVGIDRVARELLARNDTRSRLLALNTLGHLRDKTRWHELRLLADEPSPALSLAAARAMLRIEARSTLTWFLPLAAKRTDWPLARIATMLVELGADRITLPLSVTLEQLVIGAAPSEELVRILRLLETVHAERVAPVVRRVLAGARDESVIAGCLRALNEPGDRDLFREHCSHRSWIVRVAAVHQLGTVGTAADRPLLVDMLEDRNWWVRYRAAQALLALPSTNAEDLEKVRAVLPDRFARDILGHVLAEEQ